jgi:hypothetical protein
MRLALVFMDSLVLVPATTHLGLTTGADTLHGRRR